MPAHHRSVCSTGTHHRGIWRIRLIEFVDKSHEVQFELWPDFVLQHSQHSGCWMWPRDLHHVGHVHCQTALYRAWYMQMRKQILVTTNIIVSLKHNQQIYLQAECRWNFTHGDLENWFASGLRHYCLLLALVFQKGERMQGDARWCRFQSWSEDPERAWNNMECRLQQHIKTH